MRRTTTAATASSGARGDVPPGIVPLVTVPPSSTSAPGERGRPKGLLYPASDPPPPPLLFQGECSAVLRRRMEAIRRDPAPEAATSASPSARSDSAEAASSRTVLAAALRRCCMLFSAKAVDGEKGVLRRGTEEEGEEVGGAAVWRGTPPPEAPPSSMSISLAPRPSRAGQQYAPSRSTLSPPPSETARGQQGGTRCSRDTKECSSRWSARSSCSLASTTCLPVSPV